MKLYSLVISILGLGLFVVAFLVHPGSARAADTLINFDGRAAGEISGTAYPDISITSNGQSRATLYQVNNPACPAFRYPSMPNALYIPLDIAGGNSILNIAFTGGKVVNTISLQLVAWATTETVTLEAFDTNGNSITSQTTHPRAQQCTSTPFEAFKFESGTSTGIASIKIHANSSIAGTAWGVDDFSYSTLREPTPLLPPTAISSCQGSPARPRNDISWQPVQRAQNYKVTRDDNQVIPAATVLTPFVYDMNPTAGTTYTYSINTTGPNGLNDTKIATVLTITCGDPPPDLPSVRIVSGKSVCSEYVNSGNPENFIQWDQNSSANYYILNRGNQFLNNIWPPNYFIRSGWMSVFDEAPTPGLTYTYSVTPVYDAGRGKPAEISITTLPICSRTPPPDPILPPAPVIDGRAGCSTANQPENTLTWGYLGSGVSYNVYNNSATFFTNVPEKSPPLPLVTYKENTTAGATSYYGVQAVNSVGTSGLSNIVALVGKDCSPISPPPIPSAPTLTIDGPASVLFGSQNQYNAKVLDSTGQPISQSDYTVAWSLQNVGSGPFIGSLNSSGPANNVLLSITKNNCQLSQAKNDLVAFVQFVRGPFKGNTSLTSSMRINVNDSCLLSILGDIFGGGPRNQQNANVSGLSVGPNSVVSSTGNINIPGRQDSTLSIQNYNPEKKLDWHVIQSDADSSNPKGAIYRLINESATPISQNSVNSTFDLNPNGNANPEGGVWYIQSDLNLNNVVFKGRGTIIVKGNVISKGYIKYDPSDANSMLGIISLGNISFSSQSVSGDSIVGSYFAPLGTIKFGPGLTTATGLFVGDKVEIDSSLTAFRINYDGRITKNPVPGFGQSFVPSLGETAP